MNMTTEPVNIANVTTQIKNPDLVRQRRMQIIDAAVVLFIKKGFHKTTIRQISQAAGLPIGTLYDYIASKEDILYLVCEAIHAEAKQAVSEALATASGGKNSLAKVIRGYFLVCNKMSDHILLIYQETQSLPSKWRKKVLENEILITGIFIDTLSGLIESGDLPSYSDQMIELIANNITVLGHMWTFRRWYLARHYSIDDYIKLQTEFILGTANIK